MMTADNRQKVEVAGRCLATGCTDGRHTEWRTITARLIAVNADMVEAMLGGNQSQDVRDTLSQNLRMVEKYRQQIDWEHRHHHPLPWSWPKEPAWTY